MRTFFELPNGIPSHDTISLVFEMISPVEFENCFLSWLRDSEIKKRTVLPVFLLEFRIVPTDEYVEHASDVTLEFVRKSRAALVQFFPSPLLFIATGEGVVMGKTPGNHSG